MRNKYFFVTIDTERDCSPDWASSSPLTFNSVLKGIPNLLQPLFNSFEITPTYLLGVEVLENKNCVNVIKNLNGLYELGTHLHGELIEPNKKYEKYEGILTEDFSCFYEEEEEFSKLKNITELFISKFGYEPKSFRAGRFGAGTSTIKSLEKLGYIVDTSVTPHISWKNKQGVVDFSKAPLHPYHPDTSLDIAKEGKSNIIEMPVTIIKRFFSSPIWLRPFYSSAKEMINLMDFMEKKERGKDVFLNMMFHSMEIIPKASPYPQIKEEVEKYLDNLGYIFREAQRRGYTFLGLSKVKEVWKR